MFCGKCGYEVANDMEFCPKCGNKMKKDASEVAKEKETVQNATESSANTNEQPTSTPKSGMTSSTRKILIGVGVFAVLAIICIIAIINSTKCQTINLDDFVTISAEGYDGYGTAKYELNTDALTADFISKYKLKQGNGELENTIIGISNGLGLTDIACAEAFLLELGDMGLSKTEGLSNGDEIVFSWKTLSANNGESVENLLKDYFRIKVEHEDIRYKVSDLEPVETVDPFEGADISFSGVTGSDSITMNSKSNVGINFVIDSSGPYDNGQNVVVKAIPADYADWSEYTMNTGREPEKETMDMTISGLDTLITTLDQIPDKFHDEMIKSADAQVVAFVNQQISNEKWCGKDELGGKKRFEYSDPILCKEYLISSPKEATNEMMLLYRVDYHVENDVWRNGGFDSKYGRGDFPVYIAFRFNGERMLIGEDGNMIDGDTTGEIIKGGDVWATYRFTRDRDGELDKHTTWCYFNNAFTLEDFEMKYIDSRAESKDIKTISEYDESKLNVKSIVMR